MHRLKYSCGSLAFSTFLELGSAYQHTMGRVWGLLATIIAGASAYSFGAPGGACDTLLPRHGVAAQDNAHSPYSVTVSSTTLISGGTLEVTVKGSTNFKGFMIQVNVEDRL